MFNWKHHGFSLSHWHLWRGFSFTDPEIVLNPNCLLCRIHILLLHLQGSPSGLTLPGFFYFLTFVNTRAVSSQTFFSLCPRAGLPCLGVLTPTFPKLPKCSRALPDSLRSYSPRKGSHIPPASSYHPSLLGTPTAPEISWHGAEFCLPNITVRSAGAMPSACFEFNFR